MVGGYYVLTEMNMRLVKGYQDQNTRTLYCNPQQKNYLGGILQLDYAVICGEMRLIDEVCDRCGHIMKEIQPCHLICPNCGSHLDCSDKGSVW